MKRTLDSTARLDSSYTVKESKEYTRRVIPYQQPTEISHFSYDEERRIKWDRSSLGYYLEPELPSNLSTGKSSFVKRDEDVNEHLDSLLMAIDRLETPANVDFVTWRGMINKILLTPYSNRDGWEMNVSKSKDTIYLEEVKRKRDFTNEKEEMFMYYYVFSSNR
jgi:RAT1-interacting protein